MKTFTIKLGSLAGSISVLVFLLLQANTAFSQSTAARPDRGMMPNGSYSVSDIENISLTSGNLNVSIPLASLPPTAGGKLGFTLSAVYNSKLWNITRSQQQHSLLQGCQSWVVDTPQLSDLGGWRIAGEYVIVFRNAHEDFDYVRPQPPGTADCESNSQEQLLLQDNWYRAILIAPDGSEHELRPTDGYTYYSGTREYLRNYYNMKPDLLNAPMRYHSLDGSYMSVIINPSSYATQWTVSMKDGTQVIQYSSGIQRIKDTNGNSVKIYADTNGMHYQDEQTGREIRYGADGKIWYQTVGGGSHSIDIVWGTTNVQGKVYRVNAWNDGGGETGSGTACTHDEPLDTQLAVIREIVFPVTEPGQPGRKFTFNYNSDTTSTASDEVQWSSCSFMIQTYSRTVSKGMGELSQITTPTGAVVNYSYSRDQMHNLGEPDEIAKGTVTQKQVIHDGTTDTWFYSIDEFGGTGGIMAAPDGSTSGEAAYSSRPGFGQYFGSGGMAGLVYRSGFSAKQIVERHWVTTPFSGANNSATAAALTATFNPVVDAEYPTLLDDSPSHNPIKMSAKTYQYDFNGNVTQTTEYDWFDPALVSRDAAGVPTGVPGSAVVLRVVKQQLLQPGYQFFFRKCLCKTLAINRHTINSQRCSTNNRWSVHHAA